MPQELIQIIPPVFLVQIRLLEHINIEIKEKINNLSLILCWYLSHCFGT